MNAKEKVVKWYKKNKETIWGGIFVAEVICASFIAGECVQLIKDCNELYDEAYQKGASDERELAERYLKGLYDGRNGK